MAVALHFGVVERVGVARQRAPTSSLRLSNDDLELFSILRMASVPADPTTTSLSDSSGPPGSDDDALDTSVLLSLAKTSLVTTLNDVGPVCL